MAFRISTGVRNALLDDQGVRTLFTNGVIEIRTGAQPAAADNAPLGTLLGRVTADAGAFSAGAPANGINFDVPVDGVLSKAAAETWKFVGIAVGTAGWFRLLANGVDDELVSAALPRIDGSIATVGGDLLMPVTAVTVNAPYTIDALTVTIPVS